MLKKLGSLAVAALLLVSMTSCSGGAAKTAAGSSASAAGTGTLPTVVVGFTDNSTYDSSSTTWPTDVFKDFQEAVRKKCGINLKFKGWDDDQSFELALASNDLPDMFEVQRNYVNSLLNGNHVLALDSYLSLAPNFTSLSKIRIAAMRKYFSKSNDGKLYFWTPYVGTEAAGSTWWNGMTIRWDYYKELGYPTVKTEDDFLNVVKEAVAKHPKTADGKKVYGVATFSDGTLWGWWIRGCMYGYHNITDSYSLDIRNNANVIVNNYTNLESPVWRDISYYYKANQLGLFDPDSLTMKGDDLNALATNGQLVSTNCAWYGGNLNTNELAKDSNSMAEYMVLPVEGQYNWGNATGNIGWSFFWGVNSNTKYPQQVMKLIDYINTPEGARMGYMGKEGHLWNMVNNKPTITQSAINLKNKGGDAATIKTGGVWNGFFGVAGSTLCADGSAVDLWNNATIWAKTLTPAEKDFSKHYDVQVPAQAAEKLIKEGKAYDKSKQDQDLLALLPSEPQNISRIDSRCLDIMVKAIPKLVLAKNQDEFNKIQTQTLAAFKSAGVETSEKWWNDEQTSIKSFLSSVS